MSLSDRDRSLLALNQQLLEAAVTGDWAQYKELCANSLSCFEAETNGHLVEGLAFHHHYFPEQAPTRVQAGAGGTQVTMARPHLRWLGDDAVVISYTRLVQRQVDGTSVTSSCCETRVWQQLNGAWKLVHVHRS